MALLCVTAPLALTVRLPPTVEAPNVSALASVIATLFAPLLFSDTAPRKSFVALVSVIAAAPALKLEAPVPVEMFVPPACARRAHADVAQLDRVGIGDREVVVARVGQRYRTGEVIARVGQRDRTG